MTLAVYDENDEIVGEVEYDNNLDYWDGRNYTCGSTGRHKGLAQMSDGQFVLINGSQWQKEKNTAKIISKRQAVQEVLKSGNTNLFDDFPELEETREEFPSNKIEKSKVFSIRINKESQPEEIERKIRCLKTNIDKFLSQ